ncbi:hypothetical protein PHSY_005760 [Pseudozyma hubeiensis SY62]|uniref:Uncharacterized protein n=1 Tax=Pseudozyma hubeiensis (strain SY62) TaxID=1305764 RepID=R9P9W9_PSEHS|nr:hypothetical protein PHSY_005760 [Pseudozyma hubeiensis SY62]GAC98171.1 hypothetical protein PHSY_005760 [Pseudozyma hubeiensis SY62]
MAKASDWCCAPRADGVGSLMCETCEVGSSNGSSSSSDRQIRKCRFSRFVPVLSELRVLHRFIRRRRHC